MILVIYLLFNIVQLNQLQKNYQQTHVHVLGAVVTRAQAKTNAHLNSSTNLDTSIEEISSIDDQPLREEGHEFDVLAIGEAQKKDKLYQTKVLEIQANPNKHTYTLENEILYKLVNSGISTENCFMYLLQC